MFILVLCTPLSCNILTHMIILGLYGPLYVQILAPPLATQMFILVLCTPLSCNILIHMIILGLYGPPMFKSWLAPVRTSPVFEKKSIRTSPEPEERGHR